MPSIKENIRKIREKFENSNEKNGIANKIKEEFDKCKNENLSQNQVICQLEEKQQEAEQKQEKDISNIYAIVIAILKDLWSKKNSEAEKKTIQMIIEKTGIKLQEYQIKSNIEKQQYIARKIVENLKSRVDLLNNTKKIIADNKNIMQFCKYEFGNIGANIINQFNFENKPQKTIMNRNCVS